MVKIGLITDIHNNIVALSAMLETLTAENCDKIICCGDIIGIGPYPEQTVQRVMKIRGLLAVKGNHDRYLTEGMPGKFPNEEAMSFSEMEHHKWEHRLLSKQSINFLDSLPYRIDVEFEKMRFTALHYAMDENGNYTKSRQTEDLDIIFSNVDADVIIYGHEHEPAVHKIEGKLYINCGSLGCPSKDKNIARGGILTVQNGSASFEYINTPYDVESVLREIDRINYPDAQLIKKVFYGTL
ncbi:MAG: hypothetical protein ABT01_01865 [Clostridium sp. SCN 57-10]|nr:MAG: hypothetical protein ABT01_01865 [Clostridium sp. SCN 57-10]